jgi:DNA-binding NarL/FixJ family response regulator
MEKISVFLADWQVLFREGIHFTLSGEEDIEVIGEATDNEEALSSIEGNPPTVAVLNANRNKPSGIEITRRIKQNLPSVSVIIIMDNDNEEELFSAMKSGASACINKETDPDELVKIIREVAVGIHPINEALFKPEIASRVIDEFETSSLISKEVDNLLAGLSLREADILRQIADGNTMEQLVQATGTDEETIKHRLDSILSKLVANDHNREVIEAAQSRLPSIMSKVKVAGKAEAQYITRDEFTSFKESLMERFKSLMKELT